MKSKSVFLMAAVSLGLLTTACNKEGGMTDQNEDLRGNTYASLALSFDAPASRAADDDYNAPTNNKTWGGNDKVEKLAVYTFEKIRPANAYTAGGKRLEFTEFESTTVDASGKLIVKTKPFATSEQIMAVVAVVNPTDGMLKALDTKKASLTEMETYLKSTSYARAFSRESIDQCESAGKVGTDKKDLVPMTGDVVKDKVIEPGVTEADVLSGKNSVRINLSRVASRVIVTLPTATTGGSYEVKDNGVAVGTVKDVKWTVGQFEKSFYFVQKTNTADQTAESPNYTFKPTTADEFANASTHYDYSQLIYSSRIAPATLADYATVKGDGKALIEALKNDMDKAKFITETTHNDGKVNTANNNYVKGNTAYVLIQATFTPATGAWGTGQAASYVAGSDIVLGLTNKKFYTSVAEARGANGVAGQKVQTFKKGKMIYMVWVNPNDINKPLWSPIHRNNVYHIHVSSFASIGLNWNPLVPNNPNTPKDPNDPNYPSTTDPGTPVYPENPKNTDNPKNNPNDGHHNPDPNPDKPGDSPDNPYVPTDPITTPKTYMGFDINVLGWTVHTYEVNVGVNP